MGAPASKPLPIFFVVFLLLNGFVISAEEGLGLAILWFISLRTAAVSTIRADGGRS